MYSDIVFAPIRGEISGISSPRLVSVDPLDIKSLDSHRTGGGFAAETNLERLIELATRQRIDIESHVRLAGEIDCRKEQPVVGRILPAVRVIQSLVSELVAVEFPFDSVVVDIDGKTLPELFLCGNELIREIDSPAEINGGDCLADRFALLGLAPCSERHHVFDGMRSLCKFGGNLDIGACRKVGVCLEPDAVDIHQQRDGRSWSDVRSLRRSGGHLHRGGVAESIHLA